MRNKVFLTFLGTGNYQECMYAYQGKQSKKVIYVQTALVDIIAPDCNKYIAFCTESAFNTHFEQLNKECGNKFTAIKIPNGLDETEIWSIFQKIYDELNDNDEVILDITHSFRFIPMLGITLLQYAKFLKKIDVKGLYYGAFDARNEYDNVAPILNLTSFSALQDWSMFGSQFINTGNIMGLNKIIAQSISPILRETRGSNIDAQRIREINKNLEDISLDFSTCRGNELKTGEKIIKLRNDIGELEKNILPAFTPIMEKVKNELKDFEENNYIKNLFASVKWCIDKDLIQQGITQLQEAVITIISDKLGNLTNEERQQRSIISSYLGFGISKPQEEWKEPLTTDIAKQIIQNMENDTYDYEEISKAYSSLSEYRNNINHGGYNSQNIPNNRFKTCLEEQYRKLYEIFLKNAH